MHQKFIDSQQELDKLDCDSYLLASFILRFFIISFIYCLIYLIISVLCLVFFPCVFMMTKSFKIILDSIKSLFSLIILFLFLAFLLFPCILVIISQMMCIYKLFMNISDSSMVDEMDTLFLLKIFIIIFFFFITLKEISNAFDSMGYFYMFIFQKEFWSKFFEFICSIIPQLIQILITFAISYVSLLIIHDQGDDPTNLIQNFAGLVIIL